MSTGAMIAWCFWPKLETLQCSLGTPMLRGSCSPYRSDSRAASVSRMALEVTRGPSPELESRQESRSESRYRAVREPLESAVIEPLESR